MGTFKTVDDKKKMQEQPVQNQQPVQQNQQSQPVQQNQGTQYVQQPQSQQANANVANAQQLLQQGLESTGGSYQSKWTEKLNGLLDKITNRQPFQYDVNADALYQMYKDQYVRQGRMAMQDTMGQAATMTGGYGNSYAQNAGQQAYEGYLQQLTAKIPELYQAAYDQYSQEGQDLYNQYNLLGSRDAADYDRFANERNYQYTVSQNEQKLAQGQVDYLLSLGVTPNEELLKAAGYNSQYVNEVLARTKPQSVVYSGGGGGGSGAVTPAKISGVIGLGRGPISLDKLTDLVASGDVKAEKRKDGVINVSNVASPQESTKKTSGIATPMFGSANPFELLTKKIKK